MGALSFWYVWASGIRKKFINLTYKKGKIFRGGSNWPIFSFIFWGVANFKFNFLSHFLINFKNSCAYLGEYFLKFLNPFYILMFLNKVMQETRKICTTENGSIWATPKTLPIFKNEIYQLFLFLWIKSTKMKLRLYFAMQKVQKMLKTP